MRRDVSSRNNGWREHSLLQTFAFYSLCCELFTGAVHTCACVTKLLCTIAEFSMITNSCCNVAHVYNTADYFQTFNLARMSTADIEICTDDAMYLQEITYDADQSRYSTAAGAIFSLSFRKNG